MTIKSNAANIDPSQDAFITRVENQINANISGFGGAAVRVTSHNYTPNSAREYARLDVCGVGTTKILESDDNEIKQVADGSIVDGYGDDSISFRKSYPSDRISIYVYYSSLEHACDITFDYIAMICGSTK